MNILFTPRNDWQSSLEKACELLQCHGHFCNFSNESMQASDYIFPISIGDVIAASRHFKHLTLYPNTHLIHTCEDKHQFDLLLKEKGLEQYSPLVEKEARVFPYVLKGKKGEWGSNTYIIKNQTDEQLHSDKLWSDDYFIQRYIKGE